MPRKPSDIFPCSVPRSEWIVVPPTFTADIPVGPSKRTLGFPGSYNDKAMFWYGVMYFTFTKRDSPARPLPERNTCTVQHHDDHILHNI